MLLTAYMFCSATESKSQDVSAWQNDLRYLQRTVHEKYSNLFYNISATDWDKAVDSLYTQIPALDNYQRLTGFIKLVARFHIGHTQMNTFGMHASTGAMQLHRYPFQLYWFNDGVYMISAEEKYASAVGGKITMIGNMKIDDALETMRPLVSYENEQGFKGNAVFFLATPEFVKAQGIANSADEIMIKYIKDGKESTVVFAAGNNNNVFSPTGLEIPAGWVSAKKNTDVPLWQKEPSAYRYMQYLPDTKTLYVRHSVTLNDGNKTIDDFFERMVGFIDSNDVQQLILDIRMNGGGNNNLNKSIIRAIIESRKINQKGKFFCVTGRRTFSAAQNLVNELEKYTEVTFVGEPTSENVNFYGDVRAETLPATGLQAALSWIWWQNMSATDNRKQTSPELAADMSFSDYYNNEDPALKAIFKYENEKPFLPTLVYLISNNKNEEAYQYALNYANDPAHRYVADKLEANINQEGYNQMRTHIETASALFEINMKLFPESANACDSYAESLMYLGKKEDAVKYYEMAIAKDKVGITAENSRKMIEKIKNGN